uniref:Uncharacterized protein n=1 Tax=Malurus cyaneus samueli TaxID=2593467 RepID=A0A8C5UB01_9PASS
PPALPPPAGIGVGLVGFGLFFLLFGILLYFDSVLLAFGNLLFISGLVSIIGLPQDLHLLLPAPKLKGTVFFSGGCWCADAVADPGIAAGGYGFVSLSSVRVGILGKFNGKIISSLVLSRDGKSWSDPG